MLPRVFVFKLAQVDFIPIQRVITNASPNLSSPLCQRTTMKKTNVKAWDTLWEPWWMQHKWECSRDKPTVGHNHFLFFPEPTDYISLPLSSLGEVRWLSSSQWNMNRWYALPPSHNPPCFFPFRSFDAKGQSDLSSHALKTEEPQDKEHGLLNHNMKSHALAGTTCFVTDVSLP